MLNASAFKTQDPLSNYSIRYSNDLDGYAALKIFTPFYVPKSTFKWYAYAKENLQSRDLNAPSGSEAPTGNYSVFTNTSTAKEYAFKHLVLGKDARDFDRPVADLNQDAAAANMDALMIAMEIAAHTKATTAANYPSALTSTLGAGATWAVAGGDPFEDVRLARQAVFEACGKAGNAMALSYKAMEYLRIHPGITERIKYTSAASITNQMIAALLGLDVIIVSKAVYNSALEGSADVLASIWDDDAVIFHKNDTQALRSLTYGRTFLVSNFYTKLIDKPELGRDGGAHFLESGWEWSQEFASQVSDTDADSNCGYALLNVF
jgi:hypothetical protein